MGLYIQDMDATLAESRAKRPDGDLDKVSLNYNEIQVNTPAGVVTVAGSQTAGSLERWWAKQPKTVSVAPPAPEAEIAPEPDEEPVVDAAVPEPDAEPEAEASFPFADSGGDSAEADEPDAATEAPEPDDEGD